MSQENLQNTFRGDPKNMGGMVHTVYALAPAFSGTQEEAGEVS